MTEHDDIGKKESVPTEESAPTDAELRRKMAAMFDAITESNKARIDDKYQDLVQEHNIKVGRQHYWLRVAFSIPAAVLPWIVLYLAAEKIESEAFAALHPAAQSLLISGSFLTVMVLYGFLLKGVFGLLQNTPQRDISKNPHSDLPEHSNAKQGGMPLQDFPPPIREFFEKMANRLPRE